MAERVADRDRDEPQRQIEVEYSELFCNDAATACVSFIGQCLPWYKQTCWL